MECITTLDLAARKCILYGDRLMLSISEGDVLASVINETVIESVTSE